MIIYKALDVVQFPTFNTDNRERVHVCHEAVGYVYAVPGLVTNDKW